MAMSVFSLKADMRGAGDDFPLRANSGRTRKTLRHANRMSVAAVLAPENVAAVKEPTSSQRIVPDRRRSFQGRGGFHDRANRPPF